jgi:hypothetical protein
MKNVKPKTVTKPYQGKKEARRVNPREILKTQLAGAAFE